jgi:hypothetical protein
MPAWPPDSTARPGAWPASCPAERWRAVDSGRHPAPFRPKLRQVSTMSPKARRSQLQGGWQAGRDAAFPTVAAMASGGGDLGGGRAEVVRRRPVDQPATTARRPKLPTRSTPLPEVAGAWLDRWPAIVGPKPPGASLECDRRHKNSRRRRVRATPATPSRGGPGGRWPGGLVNARIRMERIRARSPLAVTGCGDRRWRIGSRWRLHLRAGVWWWCSGIRGRRR